MADMSTMIIVDRNPRIRDFLSKEFSREGYHVIVARDGKQLMDMLNSSWLPALLIMDLDIPCANGLQVLQWLKEHCPTVPVVIHTDYTEFMGSSLVQDAAAFVEKTGYNVELLKATVRRVLRGRADGTVRVSSAGQFVPLGGKKS